MRQVSLSKHSVMETPKANDMSLSILLRKLFLIIILSFFLCNLNQLFLVRSAMDTGNNFTLHIGIMDQNQGM